MSGAVDVVNTAAEAESLRFPPLLVIDTVTAFLDKAGLGTGPVTWDRIGEGQSNVTFRIRREGADLVLRRGPRPPLPPSTHDMGREAAVQRALASQGFAVPNIVAECNDESVLGVPFYLMEFLEGDVITDELPARFDSLAGRRGISEQTVDTLVALHQLDVTSGPLASLGKPEGYLERQVTRFISLSKRNATRELPGFERIGLWLADHLPQSQRSSVVHGDFRIGNLMFGSSQEPRVSAVLDWEMATLGDPLADLGYLTATYAEPGEPGSLMELTSVTRGTGFLRRDELVERYCEQLPLDTAALPWYQTLALWKAAVFTEAIYGRWLAGERNDADEFGESLREGVPALLEAAERFAGDLSGS